MKEGAHVRVTSQGGTLTGRVLLASENANSLMLWVDGALHVSQGDEVGVLVGLVPLLRKADGYHELLCDSVVTVEEFKPS